MEINKHLEGLSGSELSSVLIDAFSRRSEGVSPASVLTSWERDRFVRPSDVSPKDFLLFDKTAYDAAEAFEAIELSPLCPFGTNTSVAPMSQKIVLSTIRSSEVVADSTNVLALECAIRRRALLKTDPKNASLVRLCASHRLVRVQKFNFPGATAHFRVFSLCSAGRDTGSHAFEVAAMVEHVSVMTNFFIVCLKKDFSFPRYAWRSTEKPVSRGIWSALPCTLLFPRSGWIWWDQENPNIIPRHHLNSMPPMRAA